MRLKFGELIIHIMFGQQVIRGLDSEYHRAVNFNYTYYLSQPPRVLLFPHTLQCKIQATSELPSVSPPCFFTLFMTSTFLTFIFPLLGSNSLRNLFLGVDFSFLTTSTYHQTRKRMFFTLFALITSSGMVNMSPLL